MISNFMASVYYLLKDSGMLSDIISDAKECCLNVVAPQGVENEFCRSGYRPVIKGQEQLLTIRWHSPNK